MVEKLSGVPPEKRRAVLSINGQEYQGDVESLELIFFRKSDRTGALGVLEYGMMPAQEGPPRFDTWRWMQSPGSVVIPFTITAGQLFIGIVREFRALEQDPRHCPDGMLPNAPRGHLEAGRSLLDVAADKLATKVGELAEVRPFALDGAATNVDTAWFCYEDQPDGSQGGVAFFAVEIPSELLEEGSDGVFHFKTGVLLREGSGSAGQKVLKCEFRDWQEVMAGRCMMTVAGVGRLVSHLMHGARLRPSPSWAWV